MNLRCFPILGMILALALLAPPGAEAACQEGKWKGWKRSLVSTDDASTDLYNGLLYMGALAPVVFATGSRGTPRFNDTSFDDTFRDGLRISSISGRRHARRASDFLAFGTLLTPLLLDTTLEAQRGDCDEAFDIATDWAEAAMLTVLITQSTKRLTGRGRPSAECEGLVDCDPTNEFDSFFSGHSSLAAVGAGLLCRNSVRRRVWGDGLRARAVPCGLGVSAALTAGMLRIAADRHWTSDVLLGWAVGGLLGYFDPPGPADLLRFRVKRDAGVPDATGLVMPLAPRGGLGFQAMLQF